MAGSGAQELGKLCKKKAKTGNLGDGPSAVSPFSSLWRADGVICRGEAAGGGGGGGGEELELAAEEGSLDPLVVFGSGIMMMILNKLDARSVALSRLVSRGWLAVASSDKIWAPKENKSPLGDGSILLSGKCVRSCGSGRHTYHAYLMFQDFQRWLLARCRSWMAAPEYWRELDPYWRGTGAPMRRYFHPDGSITADPDDKVWGGHESSYTVVTGLLSDGKVREHYVRINRWPKMTVQRRPDWSWVLANHLYCYTSIPDAGKEEGTGPAFPVFR